LADAETIPTERCVQAKRLHHNARSLQIPEMSPVFEHIVS